MSVKEHVIAVIPARYASTRLPGKPLIDLCGMTMIQRTYEQAAKASLVNRVIVAADDERVASAVRAFGGNVMMTSQDIKSGSDRVAVVASKHEASMYVNVQGDEPIIDPRQIDQAVRTVTEDTQTMVGTLAKKIEFAELLTNPSVVKVVFDANRYAMLFSRSVIPYLRDSKKENLWHKLYDYYLHVGIYVFRRAFLLKYPSLPESPLENAEKLEQLRILYNGYKIKVGITEYQNVAVDTPDDVETVRRMLKTK
jgi:3-deoxy-manno-octulosonate cytidylyltransferase (CMP-KDO synthetase)